MGHDVVHEAPRERGLGVDEVAGGRHLLGPPDADRLWQQDGEAPARHDPDPRVGVGEPGSLGRHEVVARQRQLEAAGDGDAVDRADHRRVQIRERAPVLRSACVRSAPVSCRASPPGRQLLEVESGAERGVGAGEDDGRDVVAPSSSRSDRGQRLAQLAVQRVAGVGAVERDDGDRTVDGHSTVSHEHSRSCERRSASGERSTPAWPGRRAAHPSSSAGRKSSFRSPRRTSVDAIQPPMAEKWSSRIDPSASVDSSSS